jgi:SAM-dependent methyltransferase
MQLTGRTHFIYTVEEALLYDTVIEREIPCYHEMHRVIRDVFPYDNCIEELRYLELGIGTGNLTKYIIEAYTNIRVDGYDISPQMLEIARSKLQNYSGRVRLHCADVFEVEFSNNYHVATIFLCEDQERIFTEDFLNQIYHSLVSNGVFIICCGGHFTDAPLSEFSWRRKKTDRWTVNNVWEKKPFGIFMLHKI